jgi:hypothetical protein
MSVLSVVRDSLTRSTSSHKPFEEKAREVEFFMNTAAGRIVQFGGIAKEMVRTAAIHLSTRPIKINSASGFWFLTDFRQKRNRVLRKEIACQSSMISVLRTVRR